MSTYPPIKKKIKDSINGVDNAGVITLTSYQIDSPRAEEINKILSSAVLIDRNIYNSLIGELTSICKVRTITKHNRVVLTGRSVGAGILAGETTYTGIINYGALGTASTAISDSDTVLDTEVKRKAVATRTRTNDQVNFDFYYSKSDTSGTYEEFGMFIDGTSTVDTGQLFNRLLTGGWTKSSLEALTVSVQININAA